MNMFSRTKLINGIVEVGSCVVVIGPRFNGRKGKVTSIANGCATVNGQFGAYGRKGRQSREFFLDQVSLYEDDMDESTLEAH